MGALLLPRSLRRRRRCTRALTKSCVFLEDIDEDSDVIVEEAELHDLSRWPHRHSESEINRMFPLAVAAEEVESASEEERREHHLLHQRWATLKVTVGRG